MFTENELLAWLDSKINLSLNKLQTVEIQYENTNNAILDGFKKIDVKNKWASKVQNIADYNLEIQSFLEKNRQANVQIISVKHLDYPKKFAELTDPPVVLYCQGNLDLLKYKSNLTVVGSRNYSKYSELVLKKVLTSVCQQNISIISGLALGIDGLAHQIAAENNCPTIGIIGSGLDDANFYPGSNLALKKNMIQKGGLVISQFCLGTKANPYNFPTRNKLLASLSDITWVVQASLKSGSLITASIATELGKTIATTPASILDANFAGNIKLLKDGAQIITSSEDIFDLLGLQHLSSIDLQKEIKFESEVQKLIYNDLVFEAKNVEQIAVSTGLEFPIVTANLSLLEISNLVTNLGGNVWVKS